MCCVLVQKRVNHLHTNLGVGKLYKTLCMMLSGLHMPIVGLHSSSRMVLRYIELDSIFYILLVGVLF